MAIDRPLEASIRAEALAQALPPERRSFLTALSGVKLKGNEVMITVFGAAR